MSIADSDVAQADEGETQAHPRPPSAALPDLITLDTIDHFHLAD